MLADPALSNTGDDDRGADRGDALVAYDEPMRARWRPRPALRRTSSGYLGTSDGWTDLRDDHRLDWTLRRGHARQRRADRRTALTGVAPAAT